jgi:hypothetical protein
MRSIQLLAVGIFVLSEPSSSACPASLQGRSWGSIRISTHVHEEDKLRRNNPELAEAVIEKVIPAVSGFWSSAMQVRRVTQHLRVNRNCKGVNGDCEAESATMCASLGGYGVKIPHRFISAQRVVKIGVFGRVKPRVLAGGEGVAADFILLVSIDERGSCARSNRGSGIVAEAFACRHDECGRPILGVIHICPHSIDPSSEISLTTLHDTLAHEMTHTFGFTSDSYHQMHLPSGHPRIPENSRQKIQYTCELDPNTKLPRVEWDVESSDPSITYSYTFPVGIISAVTTRGGVGSSVHGCDKCPLDPNRVYSSKDIEACLANIGKCSFAITTPRVVRTVREFFDCPNLIGAELDNRFSTPRCTFFDSHWKQRIFGDEFMTPSITGGAQYISPVTFAFLEDLGWYKMDYSKATPLIRGAHWGYKEGCDFVQQKCINENGNAVQSLSEKFFCNGQNSHSVCSANALHKVACDTVVNKDHIPELYRYPVNGKSSRYDYCPVYFPKPNTYCNMIPRGGGLAGEMFGDSSRCLDSIRTGQAAAASSQVRGMCFEIECLKIPANETTQVIHANLRSFADESFDDEFTEWDESEDSEATEDDDDTWATDSSEDSQESDEAFLWGYHVTYMASDNRPVRIATPCTENGQTIDYGEGSIICSSPSLICSKHIAPHMGLNLAPFGNPEGARGANDWAGQSQARRPYIQGENSHDVIKAGLVLPTVSQYLLIFLVLVFA